MSFGGCMPPSLRKFCILQPEMLNFRHYFSLNVSVYIMIWGLYDRLPKKILHLVS